MTAQVESTSPLKVFIWTTPRGASTTLLKCMTFVPDTIAWFEPYHQIWKFSLKLNSTLSESLNALVEKHGGQAAIEKIESGYDASDKNFAWLKNQLEGDFPGKKLVLVKDSAVRISEQSLYDQIPKGFRHTFFIRHPRKLTLSVVKSCRSREAPQRLKDPNAPVRKGPIQSLNELWKHVEATGLESCPIIIDVDELLENPKEILEAYCKEVGIPFSEDLLGWEAGDDVMTKNWMVPKQTILTFRTLGFHTTTFASTGFHKTSTTTDNNDHLPAHMMERLKALAEKETPYYEEMYAKRLK